MNLHKLILTKNDCYKAEKTIIPKGIMVHSTGANNPNLKRYVGPDDGLLGKNLYNNHWNRAKPEGKQICVHAFIGKLKDGSVATYQTLPWNHRGWHAGGKANDTHIGFEICEDALIDKVYFNAVYKEATELSAYLCKEYKLDPMADGIIIGHYEGHRRGIASNHADPGHWFPKHGKSIDTFRAEVKRLLDADKAVMPFKPETPAAIKKGDTVKLSSNATYYDGKTIPSWVKNQNWIVREIKGDRAVIDKNESGTNSICSPVSVKFLTVVGAITPDPTYEIYTVVKGDTLWGIAKVKLGKGERYSEIKSLNRLTSDIIRTGQKLKIPLK